MPETEVPEGAGVDVVVVEDVTGPALQHLADELVVVHQPAAWESRAGLVELVGRSRALVVRNRTIVDRDLLEGAPSLEVVARAGAGLDNIDLGGADDLGVVVVAAAGANARSVGEQAIGMALALARDLVGHDQRVRAGQWERHLGVELAGRTWAVIGLGATGRATAALARGLGMVVVAYDPYVELPAQVGEPGGDGGEIEQVEDLADVLGRAAIVSLHLPLTSETRGMVDAEFLARMRPDAYLINVARGGLVDEDALADALDGGRLAGAGLDVRAEEPPGPGRLERQERVLLTPHVAGLTVESQERIVEMLAGDIRRVLGSGEAQHAAGRHRRSRRTPK